MHTRTLSFIGLRLGAALLCVAWSNEAFADECYVIGDTSRNNISKPLGSAGNPYNSLAAAEADLGCEDIIVLYSNVVLDGGINLRDGQTLTGQPGPRGALPIISNTTLFNGGNGVQLAANNLLDGLHITNTRNSGVFGTDVGKLDILNSLITGFAVSGELALFPPPLGLPYSRSGIEIIPSADVKVQISGTELGAANSSSIGILVLAGHADVEIENVTVRDQGVTAATIPTPGISALSFGSASVDLQVLNTSVSNIGSGSCNCDGMAMLALDGSAMAVLVDGYSYINPDGDGGGSATGMEAGTFFGTGAQFEGVITNSVIRAPTSIGIQILDQQTGKGNQLNVQVRDNEVYDALIGISVNLGIFASEGTDVVTIENNVIVNPKIDGVRFTNVRDAQQLVYLLIQRNTVMNAPVGLFFAQALGGSVRNLILDAGSGGLGGVGQNRIVGSQSADIWVETVDDRGFRRTPAFTVDAANNWWGSSAGPAVVVQSGSATVTVTPYLTEDPGL